jgi:hypothetical protein
VDVRQGPHTIADERRCAGQLHPVLADEHRGLVGEIYWENGGRDLISSAALKTDEISVPVAITVFGDEVFRAQETWARRAFRNLIYFNEADRVATSQCGSTRSGSRPSSGRHSHPYGSAASGGRRRA